MSRSLVVHFLARCHGWSVRDDSVHEQSSQQFSQITSHGLQFSCQLHNRATEQPTDQRTNGPTDQPTNQPTNQSTNQIINQSTNQLTIHQPPTSYLRPPTSNIQQTTNATKTTPTPNNNHNNNNNTHYQQQQVHGSHFLGVLSSVYSCVWKIFKHLATRHENLDIISTSASYLAGGTLLTQCLARQWIGRFATFLREGELGS